MALISCREMEVEFTHTSYHIVCQLLGTEQRVRKRGFLFREGDGQRFRGHLEGRQMRPKFGTSFKKGGTPDRGGMTFFRPEKRHSEALASEMLKA
jgi:hypothetical protein